MRVKLDMTWASEENTSYGDCSGSDPSVTELDSDGGGFANKITLGKGLRGFTVFDDTASPPVCELIIEADGLEIAGSGTSYGSLQFGECFSISGQGTYDETCDRYPSGVIGLNGGVAGDIEYVEDVECSGSSIVITTNYLNFNDCGLFTGTGTAPA